MASSRRRLAVPARLEFIARFRLPAARRRLRVAAPSRAAQRVGRIARAAALLVVQLASLDAQRFLDRLAERTALVGDSGRSSTFTRWRAQFLRMTPRACRLVATTPPPASFGRRKSCLPFGDDITHSSLPRDGLRSSTRRRHPAGCGRAAAHRARSGRRRCAERRRSLFDAEVAARTLACSPVRCSTRLSAGRATARHLRRQRRSTFGRPLSPDDRRWAAPLAPRCCLRATTSRSAAARSSVCQSAAVGRLRRAAGAGAKAITHWILPECSYWVSCSGILRRAEGRRPRPARDAGEAMARAPASSNARGLLHTHRRDEHELLHDRGRRPSCLQPAGAHITKSFDFLNLRLLVATGGAARRSARRRRPNRQRRSRASRRWRPRARRPPCRPPSPPSRRTGCLQRRR